MRYISTLRLLTALAVALWTIPQAVHAVQTTSLVDFETGHAGKNSIISTQYQASFGVSFSIVNNSNPNIVTFPRIGETFNTDPGCFFFGSNADAGCGPGTGEGWVYAFGQVPVNGIKIYYDRPDRGIEPLTGMTHEALIGRYFLAYPAGTNANAVYLRVQYTTPTAQASFGLIDVDAGTEKWIVEARDASGALIGTQNVNAAPTTPPTNPGDGQIRFIQFDFRSTGQFVKELRVRYVGSAGPGLGFDYFLTRTTINSDPVVDAGPDQTVDEGTPVVLTGTASDPDNDPLTYTWTQIGGTSVTLSGGNTLTPTFTAPILPGGAGGSTTLTFELDVSDGTTTIKDLVHVTVVQHNQPPVCDAGVGLAVAEGAPVSLNGANSYDPDGDQLTYLWTLTAGPLPNLLDGVTTNTSTLAFTAPSVTGNVGGNTAASDSYTFTLTVSDSAASASCSVTVVVENLNHNPVANAGNDQTVNEATAVMLDGSFSTDPDGDLLSYAWVQVNNGAPTVVLTGANTASPSFTTPFVSAGGATLEFELTVTDGFGGVSTDQVVIHVQNINDPPNCSLAKASPAQLWPPNHKMEAVGIVGVSDPNGNATVTITSIYQDEPTNGLGDGDTPVDGIIQGTTVLVRRERSGNLNGRVYHISFLAQDFEGSCTGTVLVCVPHDQRPDATCIDEGPLYDSTTP